MANASHLHVDHIGSLLRPAALREARIRLLGAHDADHNLGPHHSEMSEVLAEAGDQIESSDFFDRGFEEIGHAFLTTTRRHPNIITNPLCNSAEGFVATTMIGRIRFRSQKPK